MFTVQSFSSTGCCCSRAIRSFSSTSSLRNPHLGSDSIKEIPNHFSHYQVLGVPHSAEKPEIKTAFRKLSKKFHPDMNQKASPKKKKVMNNNYLKIVASYEILSHDEKRSKYDNSLRTESRSGSAAPRSNRDRDFSGNVFYQERKSYSPGGINRSRGRVHYGPGYQESTSTYANFDKFSTATGSNYDVPHFDYDHHLKGNLSFERRMINKRIQRLYMAKEAESKSQEQRREKEREENRRDRLHDEINDILNLERYGTYSKTRQRDSSSSSKAVLVMGTLGIIAVGGLLLH